MIKNDTSVQHIECFFNFHFLAALDTKYVMSLLHRIITTECQRQSRPNVVYQRSHSCHYTYTKQHQFSQRLQQSKRGDALKNNPGHLGISEVEYISILSVPVTEVHIYTAGTIHLYCTAYAL